MKKVKLKINIPMLGMRTGDEAVIDTDKNGIPLDKFWRRRLKDSQIDGCVEVVVEKAQEAKSIQKQEQLK